MTGGWTRPTYDLDSGKIKPDGKTLFLATSASTNSSIDFGYSNTSSLSGYVYVDANNNGVREAGESPIGNVLLLLTGQTAFGRFISQTVRSDASGYYSFSNLPLGLYTLTEVQPRNFVDGKDSVGKLALVGIVENDRFRYIPLKAGVAASDFNFGELKGSSIAGRVYVDSNRNGILDNGEAGLAFVLLKLEGTDDRGHHVIKYTPTASDGSYHFADLRPGTYSIQEYQPTRYVSTKNQAGSRGGVVANDLIRGIALTSDVRATDYLFGERRR